MTNVTQQELRRAFGSFMTGVTVVTTCDARGAPVGFTANSLSSVSLDPPLLLVCPGKSLSTYEAFARSTHFAVNVLSAHQRDISNTFARSKADRLADVAHRFNTDGVPVIDGALAQFSCSTHKVVDAGDHCVLIGRVQEVHKNAGPGLGFVDGQYVNVSLDGPEQREPCQDTFGAIVGVGGDILLERTARGLRPPNITRQRHKDVQHDLTLSLAQAGVSARLEMVFSVFDEGPARSVYVLGQADALPDTGPYTRIKPGEVAHLKYTSQPIADMMARYAHEARIQDLSLYLGDVHSGETCRPMALTVRP